MIITGVADTSYASTPLGVVLEFYTTDDIPNLSVFGVGTSDPSYSFQSSGVQFTFPAISVAKNKFLFLSYGSSSGVTFLNSFFGINAEYCYFSTLSIFANQGGQSIELYKNGNLVDIFGETGISGYSAWWKYQFGWFYRISATGPRAPYWSSGEWRTAGQNSFTDWNSNIYNSRPFPVMTYKGPREYEVKASRSKGCDTLWKNEILTM